MLRSVTNTARHATKSAKLFQRARMLLASDIAPKTFSMQESLPPLPLPKLSDTLQKYMKSVSAIVNDPEALEKTKDIINDFECSKDAEYLQIHLMERTLEKRNWLEDWWYDAYNESRAPLPLQNMGSVIPRATICHGRQLHRAAEFIHYMMEYWMEVRRENIPISSSRGETWDMFQYYNLFNSARIPGRNKDRLVRSFKTESEGDAPTHITVLCNGYVYKLDPIINGNIISISSIYHILADIQKRSFVPCASVVSLTSEHRDTWQALREQLTFMSKKNRENFDVIEKSAFVLSLSQDTTSDNNELMFYSLFGNPQSQYCDKNFNAIVMENGQMCFHADHCNVDAISLFSPVDEACKRFRSDNWDPENTEFPPASFLHFDLNEQLIEYIHMAEKNFYNLGSHVQVKTLDFNRFGNRQLKSLGLYTDTIIQIALQLTYYTVHKQLAPTYETASTRKFYHGRTETVRSCTQELAQYCKAVASGTDASIQKPLFKSAYDAHNKLMEAARNGQGIDRHMFGLMKAGQELQAEGEKTSTRGLFADPSWAATGGGGNFKLSTSFLGYDPMGTFGYVTAMCEDGYGCFYRINPDSITFTASCYKNENVDLDVFLKCLNSSLDHIFNYFSSSKI